MKSTLSIKAAYLKNAKALEYRKKLEAAYTPEQVKCVASARACFEQMGKSGISGTTLSQLLASLESAGMGFEVLDPTGKKSGLEMEAEVRRLAGLEPGAPLRAVENQALSEKGNTLAGGPA